MEEHYAYLKGRLKEIDEKKREGSIRRVKFIAPYETAECDMFFYSKLEGQLRNEPTSRKEGRGNFTDQDNIMHLNRFLQKAVHN